METPMKIAFIGAGKVGAPLAAHLANAGHMVTLARAGDASASVDAALTRSPRLEARALDAAVHDAEVVFLAVPFGALDALLPPLSEALTGKVVVDCTNPVGPGLSHGLGSRASGSEHVQRLLPGAEVVKAFSIYGFENFESPWSPIEGVRPAMLFCGDSTEARAKVATLITDCGFEPVDVGGLAQALHLEHLTLLWVRMVRMNGHSPRLTWAVLREPRGA